MAEPIFLHICCGPCSLYSVKKLRENNFEPLGYFYNPNIHPYAEYRKRLETLESASQALDFRLIVEKGYDVEKYFRAVLNDEQQPARCERCYELRLGKAAEMASKMDVKKFTSTLFYSIYQHHDILKSVAERVAKDYGVKLIYVDFREGWDEGVEMSKKLNLYRQRYCGCIFSERERFIPEYRRKKQAVGDSQ